MWIDRNISFINKVMIWAYSIYVRKLLRSDMYNINIKVHSDFSVSILNNKKQNNYIFIAHCSKDIIKNGKLVIKFRDVGNFYCSDIENLTSDHNFPDKSKRIAINGTGITELDVNHVEGFINFGDNKLTKLKIKSTGDNFIVSGDMSYLDTLAYIPIQENIMWNKPFNYYCENNYEKLTIDDVPHTQLFIEMLFIITNINITGLERSNIRNPNHFYSKLLFILKSNRDVFGTWEPWNDHYDTIDWPKGFINENLETCVDSIVKFNL